MRGTNLITKHLSLKAILLYLFLCVGLACTKDEVAEDNVVNEDPQSEVPGDDKGDPGEGEDTDDKEDEGSNEDPTGGDDNPGSGDGNCTVADYIFNEADGLVLVEFEDAVFSGDWEKRTSESGYSGEGYMVWTGPQYLNSPGTGRTTYKIKINNPGTYQFIWRSAVTTGNSGTDHNDTWLRFADADDFFGQKGSSVVYPKGTGKTPNPGGSTADGWFKIYRGGNDLSFKWQSSTYDNNSHDIFVTFDSPGIYTMEVSVRSSGHAIDQFVLFKTPYTKGDAIAEGNTFSSITCN